MPAFAGMTILLGDEIREWSQGFRPTNLQFERPRFSLGYAATP
jgi:hypothetical protein